MAGRERVALWVGKESSLGTSRAGVGKGQAGRQTGRGGRGDEGNLPARSWDRALPAGHSHRRPSEARHRRGQGVSREGKPRIALAWDRVTDNW